MDAAQKARERSRRWRARHPGAGAAASRRYRAKHGNTPWPAKRVLGVEITLLKSTTPCADCGGLFPPECMDFDHVRGKKLFPVGERWSYGKKTILREIAKCELVCANCHRIRTQKRRRHVIS